MRLRAWLVVWLWALPAWAETVTVCERLDGSLAVTIYSARIPVDQRKIPDHLQGLACFEMDKTLLPDRVQRHAWRKGAGNVIRIDPTVPAPANPDADLEAAIQNATTLEQLKAALLSSADKRSAIKARGP